MKVAKKKVHNKAVTDSPAIVNQVPHHFIALPAPDTIAVAPVDTAGITKQLIAAMTPICNGSLCRYVTFSGKAKVHFEGPEEKQDFTANIRVKKDTAIWIDITALGGMFHAARIYITSDSFFMINYQQKEVSRISLSQVAKILPTEVDFVSLQNLIVGDPLRKGQITQVAALAGSWMVSMDDGTYTQSINYSKGDSTIEMNQVNTRKPNGPQALLKYENYELISGNKMSKTRVVNIQNGTARFSIEMDLQNIEFDRQVEMPFSVPQKYSVKAN